MQCRDDVVGEGLGVVGVVDVVGDATGLRIESPKTGTVGAEPQPPRIVFFHGVDRRQLCETPRRRPGRRKSVPLLPAPPILGADPQGAVPTLVKGLHGVADQSVAGGESGHLTFEEADELAKFFARYCTEERARTYEATIHNLQSSYDTHIQNTVLEAKDDRLPLLRAHVSASLHLIESVTHLIHFVERHEDQVRSEESKSRISKLVPQEDVQRIVVNELLMWVNRHMQSGYPIAEELLPSYTNVQELRVDLADGLTLHARPAALVVKIVNHYGTPVKMHVGDKACNAASILELLVTVGSQPEERSLVFHGDERPLRDIRLLVENDLGENGTEHLPDELQYLRS